MKAKNFGIRGTFLTAMSLIFPLSSGLNGQILSVRENFQEMDQWCWAGVTECVLDYYGIPVRQCEIVEYTRTVNDWYDFGSENVCVNRNVGANYWNYNCCRAGSISDILLHFGGITDLGAVALEEQQIVADIAARKVFIIRWGWDSGGGHFLVGHGYQSGNIYYMNPWPGEGKKIGEYQWMVQGSGHTWTSTNRMQTSPVTSKPVTPSGDTLLFRNPGPQQYFSHSVKYATNYRWTLTPQDAGNLIGTDTIVRVDWSPEFTGEASLVVCGRNNSGDGLASDSLLIKVMQPASDPTLSNLTVDGIPVVEFNPTKYDYFTDRSPGTSLPVIVATPKNAEATVTITGPEAIPGFAVIMVTAADGSVTRSYHVYFQNETPETWSWAKSHPGNSYDRGNGIHADGNGNIAVTGDLRGNLLYFESILINQIGNGDAWVARYLADGSLHWAKGIGGPGNETGKGVCTDHDGNIVFLGDFSSSLLIIGADTVRNSGISGTHDILLIKFSPTGEILWWKTFGSSHEDLGNSIVIDPENNICFTGIFAGRELTIGNKTLTNTGGADMMLVKCSPDGEALWADSATGDGDDYANQLALDPAGNVLVAGAFGGSSISFTSSVLNNEGSINAFLAKFSATGQFQWARQAGGYDEDFATGVASDNAGNVFVTGEFSSSRITFEDQQLKNSGKTDIFLAKYTAAGNLDWVRRDGGSGKDKGIQVQVGKEGCPVIAGIFDSKTIDFDGIIIPNAGQNDLYLTRYNADGTVRWSKWAGGTNHDQCHALAADSRGNLYLTGMSASPAIHLGNNTLNNTGKSMVFIARLEGTVTGIDERKMDLPVLIYPNPSSGKVTVEVPESATGIEVFSHTGQLIQTIRLSGQTRILLDLQDSGAYLIRVQAKDSRITKKLVLIRE